MENDQYLSGRIKINVELTRAEAIFIAETLNALYTQKSRIGSKNYSVTLWATQVKKLIGIFDVEKRFENKGG